MMIPKVIHYCWFGRGPKPQMFYKCLNSWKRFCRDYQIIEWNEDNFDLSKSPLYVQQAYNAKKWAFVSDYVRLWALTKNGGIYMDTDVELLKQLDGFLNHVAFSGFESDSSVSTGIMACEKGFPLFNYIMEHYENISFVGENGKLNTKTNVAMITEICVSKGLILNNTKQNIEGFTLYPKDFFCPLDHQTGRLRKTKNTVSIHWYSASWYDEKQKKMSKRLRKLRRLFGNKAGENIYGVFTGMEEEGVFKYCFNRIKKRISHGGGK